MSRSNGAARALPLLLLLRMGLPGLAAQAPPELTRERREFAEWLASAPLSPFAVIALRPVGAGISIGYEPSDIPLEVRSRATAREDGSRVMLEQGQDRVILPRGRPVPLERYRLVASGSPGRAVVAAFGAVRRYRAPTYFPFTGALDLTITLEPPERRGSFRTLGLDGAETDAVEAGLAVVAHGGNRSRLRVYRVGPTDDDEAPLMIFFRDSTNGRGSYPAGRFVELIPIGGKQYRLDFNRARNPFCAYSPVFPCPAPWPGNQLPMSIPAGERYQSDD